MNLERIRKRGGAQLASKRGASPLSEAEIDRLHRDPILRERDRSRARQLEAGAAGGHVHHAQVDAAANAGRIDSRPDPRALADTRPDRSPACSRYRGGISLAMSSCSRETSPETG